MDFKNVNNCDSKSNTPKTKINQLFKHLSAGAGEGESPFRNLPNFSTPPSRFARIVNPFEAHLLERLHLPTCSPNMLRQGTPKTEEKFKWTIDDISFLKPADIDETTMSQHVVTEDPQIESMMQQKITNFFSEKPVVPSPLTGKVEAICLVRGSLEVTPEKSVKRSRNSATQTVLTLPPILPKELEDALKPYFNYTEDQQCTEDSVNDPSDSLYKELFEFGDNEENNSPEVRSTSLSPPPAISGDLGIPAMLFSPTTRGFGSPPELKNCTISPITKTSPTVFSDDMSIDISMIVPSDKDDQQMSITCTPVKKTDTTFGKNCSMELQQVSVSFCSSSTDSDKMDVSNSNTPHAKLFTRKKHRKRLSKSFRYKLEGEDKTGDKTVSVQYEDMYVKNGKMLKNDTTDVGYCTHDTGDYSNNYSTNVFASTPSTRNAILDFKV